MLIIVLARIKQCRYSVPHMESVDWAPRLTRTMIMGHTKFSLNCFFGMFNKLFHRSSVSTLSEIAAVAEII